MNYQSFFEGAEGVGYYDVRDFYGYNDGKLEHLWDRLCWPGITSFAETEADDALKNFVLGEYPVLRQEMGEKVWWRTYVKDGGIYAIILNRETTDTNATIPLSSADGKINVGEFSAAPADISGMPQISGNGVLKATLKGDGVVIYKITPKEALDLSGLTTSEIYDTYNYSWAKTQIDNIYKSGIVNLIGLRRFSPSEKITRADFAYFLIRTLGLTSAATDNFADVNTNSYFANEIAIGKALGILKGTGGESFSPYAEISRQDMMVICARGMRAVKELSAGNTNIEGFTDFASIADYAVADIAAMVKSNMIKGNADGTINPLGNATRAEAAVIMSRIIDWAVKP